MAYVKPNTFVDGTILDADDLNGNDEELKKVLNQELRGNDLEDAAFDTQHIQLGEYQPITNQYTFATGIVAGVSRGIESEDRAYFTSNIKKGEEEQHDATPEVYMTLIETGPELVLKETADVLITYGGTFVSQENNVQDNGLWDSKVLLSYTLNDDEQVVYVQQSRSYTFEESFGTSPAGVNNPYGLTGTPGSGLGSENPELKFGLRRWIGFSIILRNLAAGSYKFSIRINPKVEIGYNSAKSFKAEVFYK